MQEWHLIMYDDFELIITCESAEITRNGLGEITNIKWNGIKDNIPVKIDLSNCKCIYYKKVCENSQTESEGTDRNR